VHLHVRRTDSRHELQQRRGEPVAWGRAALAFGIGHCGVIGMAGSSTELEQRYLDWNEQSRAVNVLKIISGLVVLVAAGVLVYTA
jgi:cytochrome c-type biogenesis protein